MSTLPTVLRPELSFRLSRYVFHRLLALSYFAAFVSLAPQILGLVGHDGIMPVDVLLPRAHQFFGDRAVSVFPTVLWWWSSDAALQVLCGLGVGLSIAALVGLAPVASFSCLWVLYLSLTVAGQTFLAFQWDTLLLETGLLGILYAPLGWYPGATRDPPPVVRWVLWSLTFKLMFLSGVTKLTSGDPTWSSLTALSFHFETQPLPSSTSWFAHHLPQWIQMTSVGGMFVTEIVAPFAAFLPTRHRRWRAASVASLCLLQLLIMATGNYGFFNLLSITLCLSLLDDGHYRQLAQTARIALGGIDTTQARPDITIWPQMWTRVVSGAAIIVALLSTVTFWQEVAPATSRVGWASTVRGVIQPFRSINGYGLFRTMTTTRPEVVVEASADGITWTEYVFRWKVGDLTRRPQFAPLHMPRLDWLLWFAALDPDGNRHWLTTLSRRLLDESAPVLGLLAHEPLPGMSSPPRFLRLALYDYEFTTPDERAKSGHWWRRTFRRYLTGVVSRDR